MNDNNHHRSTSENAEEPLWPGAEPAWPTGQDPDFADRGRHGRTPGARHGDTGRRAADPGTETGVWLPDWDDRPSASDIASSLGANGAGRSARHRLDENDNDGNNGYGAHGLSDQPTSRSVAPAAGTFEPGTEMMPLVLDDIHQADREPELLTHRNDYDYGYPDDGYNEGYDSDDYYGPPDADEPPPPASAGGSGRGRPPRGPITGRKRRWRRIRRTLYVLVALFIVVPIAGFFVAYQVVDVPSPESVLAKQTQPVTYYWANGQVMYKDTQGKSNRIMLKADEIPATVKHAVFAAEDASFESNSGFSIGGIIRAAWDHVTGGGGGGSTITQQYVKKATGDDQHTIWRKMVELVKAYKLSNNQDKSSILTGYLNIVYFGRGAYGIGAAAQEYFGTDVKHLTPAQAAFLAGLIQGPSRWNDKKYVTDRWNYVMDQMVQHHWLSASQRKSAKLPTPIPFKPKASHYFKNKNYLRFIVDRVNDELKSKGLDPKQLAHSGAKIYLTIDPAAEQKAVAAAHKVMDKDHNTSPKSAYKNLTSALVSADPHTGQIVAYYGGDWNQYQADLAGVVAHHPGSSFKPIDFTAAMQHDPSIGIGSTYDGRPNQVIDGQHINNAGSENCGKNCSVMLGMTKSVNTVFYNMVSQIGPKTVRQTAYDLGIPRTYYSGPCKKQLPTLVETPNCKPTNTTGDGIAIGSYPVTVENMAQAYSTLANHGNRIPLHFVTKVTDNSGQNVLYQFSQQAKPALDPSDPTHNSKIARNVIESMLDVAKSSHVPLAGDRPVASKTGTAQAGNGTNSSHNQAAWMVGFTPQVVTAVWTGNYQNDASPIYGAYANYLGPTRHYDIYGREEPSFIWRLFMDSYLKGKPVEHFTPFEGQELGDSTPSDHSVPGVRTVSDTTSNGSSGNSGHPSGGNNSTGASSSSQSPPPTGHHHSHTATPTPGGGNDGGHNDGNGPSPSGSNGPGDGGVIGTLPPARPN